MPPVRTSQGRATFPRAAAATRRPATSRKDSFRRRLLFTADLACFFVAVAAMTLVEGTTDPLWGIAALPGWLILAKAEGLYDNDHPKIWHLTTDEAPAIFHWITLSVAGTLLFIRGLPDETITIESAATLYVTALGTAFSFRALARCVWRAQVSPERALVIGSGELADTVARKLALEPGHHLTIKDYRTTGSGGNRHGGDGVESPTVGVGPLAELSKNDIRWLLVEARIERVVLAVPELDEPTLAKVAAACRSEGIKLSVLPPMRAMFGTAVELSHVAEMPVIEYRTQGITWSTMALKRMFDVIVSAALMLLLAPVMLVIALAVRLDSRGPAIFSQPRAGRDGRPFRIFKFRTMCHDAEERISEVISLDDLSEPMFKLRDDPRVTRLGRFLRRTSLDELPQLLNVLKGDMSLVGPRPEEVWLVERYDETQRFRLQMRPGLTGPMQIHGRGELGFRERLAIEREYVENYSLRKDAEILFRTASAMFRGAY
jgi:exopolysaccharide biosynthesis polyprenyl glycosylphosphotransferase